MTNVVGADMNAPTARRLVPGALAARRMTSGLSRREVAARASLSARKVFLYEEGLLAPAPPKLERLAEAVSCRPDELIDIEPGQETLADLRFLIGLTLARASELLEASHAGQELRVSAEALSALECGEPMVGRGWDEPLVTGRLLPPLAKIYGVPTRMVLDAWMRTRPADPAPVVESVGRGGPSRAAIEAWASLNERQRVYLGEIMRDDRMTETEMWMRRLQRLPVPPAAEWRQLPLALKAASSETGYTRLQERLRRRGVHDPGAGRTVHALARRGLVIVTEDVIDHPVAGEVVRVAVKITRRGRAAARAGLDKPVEVDQEPHLLSEWLWGVLVRVALAEPEGLPEDRLAGRPLFFLGVGYRNAAGGPPSRGLIEAVPVLAPGGTHVAEFRWRLTDLGRRHVVEFTGIYGQRYPRVDCTGLESLVV
ncbi:helix-turn-helix transcriptional regulator [Micromonospora sp. 4G57]|uniref:Helix-turn-helix transcriptional regulator n=1 Tax=Micromonospora sicca TaxID=2202420 RepID=A0ABU5JJJ7_9ACTN|nr:MULTISPECIES: helix-turn-helix transcriptional regulator [unclassified Micromonospora]MDZ5446060.1 helix-turn-helix transcriptional regulator [Micromonospora sp. 4G57]MDZ5492807.1 helix-turn-helix transcriptional regulator [Micromonospora sp. 4G53]